jgi:hypothetical protein
MFTCLDARTDTENIFQVAMAIEAYRTGTDHRPRRVFPH